MKFRLRHTPKVVGGFFLLAALAALFFVILIARGQHWFTTYHPFQCRFEKEVGLRPGSQVTLKGLPIGQVREVHLDEENRILVTFEIEERYVRRIRRDTKASIVSPMFGSPSLVLTLGSPNAPPLAPGNLLSSEEGGGDELQAILTSTAHITQSLEKADGELFQTLRHLETITASLAKAMTLLEERRLYDHLVGATSHLEHLLAGLDSSSPDLQDAITEGRRGLEEANKVIVALQKSIFLRGNVEQLAKQSSTVNTAGRLE